MLNMASLTKVLHKLGLRLYYFKSVNQSLPQFFSPFLFPSVSPTTHTGTLNLNLKLQFFVKTKSLEIIKIQILVRSIRQHGDRKSKIKQ